MFIDQAKIEVKAGDGGDGIVAFRREKYVPDGGPAGGDGGRGGDIVFKVDEGLLTLMDFRYNRHFKADKGENGMSKGMHGRRAEDLIVSVPPGTIIINEETGRTIADLTEENQEYIVAKGGRGGRGNSRFANSRNPAPSISENGEPGEEVTLILELKLLADVGLLGFPSVGKSTLLSVVTSAKPKIASYPFTTITPNIGVVSLDDGRSFVIGDMPGIIEGAADGVGLGLQFLKHIERTKVLLHLLDMSGMEGRDPFEDYLTIQEELANHDPKLLNKAQLILANKMDMPESKENLVKFKEKMNSINKEYELFEISAIQNQGLKEVLYRTVELVEEYEETVEDETIDKEAHVVFKHEPKEDSFKLSRDSEGVWILSGEEIERKFLMANFDHNEEIMRFARQLREMGIDEALRERGAKDGDLVSILDYTFEFME
ncbi:MAG: GTPase ObgE [Atopostipes suicloacalis]|nr:GTPase ObgE [Atopostipes suicloacalis]MDN6730954.1 GTPase ObgE [Atopostipes suicloacalis]